MRKNIQYVSDLFLNFWSSSFDLSLEQMKDPNPEIVTTGKYVDRYKDQYIYLFEDLYSGKRILAGSGKNINELKEEKELVCDRSIEGYTKVFEDIDYVLPSPEDFRKVHSFDDFKLLGSDDKTRIEEFYLEISEDDKDTLDITFENEAILGVYKNDCLLGIARYAPLKDEPRIADITVVIGPSHRGQGYGVKLVSRLIEEILNAGLLPRYRVNQDLIASIAIAEKLGFTPWYRVTTFSRI